MRLDQLLAQRGLAPSRERARALILAGRVRVEGTRVDKAGTRIASSAAVDVLQDPNPFVSRGGLKLAAALAGFAVAPAGWTILDVGASTGGFTDCLLQAGAARVVALDVGHGQPRIPASWWWSIATPGNSRRRASQRKQPPGMDTWTWPWWMSHSYHWTLSCRPWPPSLDCNGSSPW